MVQQVKIIWSRPCRWDTDKRELSEPSLANSVGIYQLSRRWNGAEELLYIGIVWSPTRTMNTRMKEHQKQWLGTLRGIHFYFGQVVPLQASVDRQLLEAVEGALIFTVSPRENTKKMQSYSRYDDYVIDNGTHRGAIERKFRYVDTTTALHN